MGRHALGQEPTVERLRSRSNGCGYGGNRRGSGGAGSEVGLRYADSVDCTGKLGGADEVEVAGAAGNRGGGCGGPGPKALTIFDC